MRQPDRYGIIGNPIEHSLSPIIHQAFAKQTQQTLSYEKILVPTTGLAEALEQLASQGYKGLNVTAPFKQHTYALMDELSPRARIAQAVNTIIFQENGTTYGDNTDGVGFISDIENNLKINLEDQSILILGAGGAARGILGALVDKNASSLSIANRTLENAKQVTKQFNYPIDYYPWKNAFQSTPTLIINTVPSNKIEDFQKLGQSIDSIVFYDTIYSWEFLESPFLIWARSFDNNRLYDGFGMLIEQAAESFYQWRKIKPHTGEIQKTLR